MSDNKQPDTPQPAQEYQSTEEMVAAQAAQESDLLAKAQADLAALQAKSAELADQYLRAKAEAENARRRAEEEIAKTRKFAVESFAENMLPVIDSLEAGLVIKDATL
ncbi:MAG: nucleotide exchange factor GrpE, partial [Rhodoferax sp.]|nr:nucleotide exchange factor GrpE [Rhodoferax sp.]